MAARAACRGGAPPGRGDRADRAPACLWAPVSARNVLRPVRCACRTRGALAALSTNPRASGATPAGDSRPAPLGHLLPVQSAGQRSGAPLPAQLGDNGVADSTTEADALRRRPAPPCRRAPDASAAPPRADAGAHPRVPPRRPRRMHAPADARLRDPGPGRHVRCAGLLALAGHGRPPPGLRTPQARPADFAGCLSG